MVREIGATSVMTATSTRIARIGTSTHRMQVRDWRMIIENLNQIKMENQYCFRVSYLKKSFCLVVAHTKWEAIDKAFYKFTSEGLTIDRKVMTAKKLY